MILLTLGRGNPEQGIRDTPLRQRLHLAGICRYKYVNMQRKFQKCLHLFIDPLAKEEECISIDVVEPLYNAIKSFNRNLYRQFICYPQEVIPTFKMLSMRSSLILNLTES
ncbi:hypothetical protein QTO34_008196 [Cnephaeus nilssonii]|uniref:Uncharacterized protein n=1 Tax=Cnephaeus nilssonii TaxID=3371016 RepID=A0AA40IAY9_CNENI|nr:hypothetical protein QTO34_008196 [Eptesicus nilssonii]